MIRNDEQLEVVRTQLGRVERALESLRERVEPKNPRNFAIFAESYIDQINILKADIDAYEKQKLSAPPVIAPVSLPTEQAKP